MHSDKKVGQVIGILLPIQLAIGLILQFVLIQSPLSSNSPGFLQMAAASAFQIRVAVGMGLLGGALTLAIGVIAWPTFRSYSRQLATAFLAVCAISLVMDALHGASVLSMLSLSERFLATDNPSMELYETLGAAARSTRYWMHHMQLLFVGAWIFLFYFILLRSRAVPVWIATLGLLGILLQFVGVTLPAFAGYPSVSYLAMPLAPIHLLTSGWLMVKGLHGRTALSVA